MGLRKEVGSRKGRLSLGRWESAGTAGQRTHTHLFARGNQPRNFHTNNLTYETYVLVYFEYKCRSPNPYGSNRRYRLQFVEHACVPAFQNFPLDRPFGNVNVYLIGRELGLTFGSFFADRHWSMKGWPQNEVVRVDGGRQRKSKKKSTAYL